MSERKIVFWGGPNDEELSRETKDEAIESILDGLDDFHSEITVCGYARMEPDFSVLNPLEHCLEVLDDEYGNPCGSEDDPTPAMEAAEQAFLAVIKREYRVWMCEEVTRETVDVLAWVRAHRPGWLSASPMDTAERPA